MSTSIWSSSTQYDSGQIVTYNATTYIAGVPRPPKALIPKVNNVNGAGWVPLWTAQSTFSDRSCVYYVINDIAVTFQARVTSSQVTLLSSAPVLVNNSTGFGWIPFDIKQQPFPDLVAFDPDAYLISEEGYIARVWNDASSYIAGDVVILVNGTSRTSYGTIREQSPGLTPQAVAYSLIDWLPIWRPDSTYTEGDLIALGDPLRAFTVGPSVQTDSTWDVPWAPDILYLPGALVKGSDDKRYFLVGSGFLDPSTSTTGLDGWVQVWTSGNAYLVGQYVYHNDSLYVSAGSSNLSTTAPSIHTTSTDSWVPLWAVGGAYQQNDIVFQEGRYYIAWGSTNLDSTAPDSAVDNINGWVPIWVSGVAITGGTYVYDGNSVYLIPSSLTAEDNTTRPSAGGIPVYNPLLNYSANSIVRNALGQTFIARFAAGPSDVLGSSNKWIPIYSSSDSYDTSSIVYYQSNYYGTIGGNALSTTIPSPTPSTVDSWLLIYSTGSAISQGTFVMHEGRAYYAEAAFTAETNTTAPTPGNTSGLLLVLDPNAIYNAGQILYNPLTGRKVTVVTNGTTGVPPAVNTTGTGYIEEHSLGIDIPEGGAYMVNGVRYFSVKNVPAASNTTNPNATGANGLVQVHDPTRTYNKGDRIYDIVTGRTAIATTDNLTGAISLPNKTGTGFIEEHEINKAYTKGTYVLVNDQLYFTLSDVAATINLTTPTSKSLSGFAQVVNSAATYNKKDTVYDPASGLLYLVVTDGTSGTPQTTNTSGTGFIPPHQVGIVYAPGSWMHVNGREFIMMARSSIMSSITPIVNTKGLDGIVPLWTRELASEYSFNYKDCVSHKSLVYCAANYIPKAVA
jgi:hypothetical protein